MDGIMWWGYQHSNGSLHVKRYFSEDQIEDANESPFVQRIFGPWDVSNRSEAENKLRACLGILREEP